MRSYFYHHLVTLLLWFIVEKLYVLKEVSIITSAEKTEKVKHRGEVTKLHSRTAGHWDRIQMLKLCATAKYILKLVRKIEK